MFERPLAQPDRVTVCVFILQDYTATLGRPFFLFRVKHVSSFLFFTLILFYLPNYKVITEWAQPGPHGELVNHWGNFLTLRVWVITWKGKGPAGHRLRKPGLWEDLRGGRQGLCWWTGAGTNHSWSPFSLAWRSRKLGPLLGIGVYWSFSRWDLKPLAKVAYGLLVLDLPLTSYFTP